MEIYRPIVVLVRHRHQQLQVLEAHVFAGTLQSCLQLSRTDYSVQVFVEESEGSNKLCVLFSKHIVFLSEWRDCYLLISPMN